ncbi:polysaccharide deacetylase family protein [Mesorhizobium sp. B2-3-12]|uniref:polysaccharide deacetylase family protein n=1 Tax=Mesorhizobium sp. B2-3-12 TaxID=2589952 RepID=UPI00112A0FF1|nr:polysaccharide deacetylase family protein [Mesorhizobium sp. B2-3-12]TPL86095.1 polysaccharide deacetylase family protein [Mesorhizobium sp. B2-3-12]
MPIPILMYHQIDKAAGKGGPFSHLTVSPRAFRHQMNWLKRLGWTGLSMRDLKPFLDGERSGRVVGITFDDGFRNVHSNALATLQRCGFTATNYLVSRQIGGFNKWDAGLGIPHAACMSKEEILDWVRSGHEVGAHTLDHVRLTAAAPAESRRQITDVRHELEDLIGNTVDAFCYPYGDVSEEIRSVVEEAGYASATTTRGGRARSEDDRLLLPRIAVRPNDGIYRILRRWLTG